MSTEILYSKNLVIRRLDGVTHEERRIRVQATVEMICQSSPVHRKDLLIKLTSDGDYHFLFILRVTEDDFQNLKAQHGLLVDFNAFPTMLMELFERARSEEEREVPAFIVQFVPSAYESMKADSLKNYGNPIAKSSEAKHSGLDSLSKLSIDGDDRFVMHFIETNQIQNLKRLSLRFVAARDAELKEHLAVRLRCVTEEYSSSERRLTTERDDLTLRLSETRSTLSTTQAELERVRNELKNAVNDLQTKFAAERADDRARHADERASLVARFDADRKELESAHLKIVKTLEAKLSDTESLNRQLSDRNRKLESNVQELRGRITSFEDELTRTRRELTDLRTENDQFDAELGDTEKHANALQTRVAVLEQEARDKNALLLKTSELLKSEQDQKRKLEDDIARRAKQAEKLERSVKELSDELLKANEILRKMQAELRSSQNKIKLRNKIAIEQEKVIADREKEHEQWRDEQRKLLAQLDDKESLVKRLTEQLENALEKLNESKQLLKTNENVINWLNKQITELQLAQSGVSTQPYRVRPLNAADGAKGSVNFDPKADNGQQQQQQPALLASYAPGKWAANAQAPSAGFTFANRVGAARSGETAAPKLSDLPFAIPKSSAEPAQSIAKASEVPTSKSTALDAKYFQRSTTNAPTTTAASRISAMRSSIEANELAAAKKQSEAVSSSALPNDVFSAYFPATAVGVAATGASN